MRTLILLICICFPSIALSSGMIFSNTSVSNDTDDNTIFKQEAGVWFVLNENSDLGTSITYSSFDRDKSTRLAGLYNTRFDNGIGFDADIGIESLFNEITGKVKLSKWYDAGITELNAERGFVDNVQGTQNGITYALGYLLSEYHINDFVLVGFIGQTRFSDNPRRNEARFIASYPIVKNTHVRFETQYYEFDAPSQYYFSPDEYHRYLAGIQHYQSHAKNWYSRTKLMYGRQSVNSNAENSYLLGLTVGHYFDRIPLEARLEIVFDQKEPDYTYRIAYFNLIYRF